ncbi:hypothetical protein HN924_02815 [Candidatus Woesearchaeota archaeon]|jgi:hypothetical protein|nr:hypothetical protein [Candidatus Woesearchaeota archaeon]MBT7402739.1 hypothetical protein [Candidatus Woesearchaeota archaeon]
MKTKEEKWKYILCVIAILLFGGIIFGLIALYFIDNDLRKACGLKVKK